MGSAKHRQKIVDRWLKDISAEERTIVRVALSTFDLFIRPNQFSGGCYLISFFLKAYLRREYGIPTEAIVGWVNDGTGPIMVSHAWLEYRGKKIDLTLNITETPDVQIPGPVLILDMVLVSGQTTYTYHREPSARALAAYAEIYKRVPESMRNILLKKEQEHLLMLSTARSEELMTAFLENAPLGRDYRTIANAISQKEPQKQQRGRTKNATS